MCGIVAIYNLNGNDVDQGLLEKMTRYLAHRGPQNQGRFISKNCGLGYRRLTIIDTVEQPQPILQNEDGYLHISFNGEIYNYQKIREELLTKSHRFYTKTDTETIVHLFEEQGIEAVKKLNGIFAFFLFDEKNDILWVARDHLGVKPLYYTIANGVFLAASEIKALLQSPAVKREVDVNALSYYLSLRYVPAPLTMFKGIYKLLPGHWMKIDNQGVHTEQYWDVDFKISNLKSQISNLNEEELEKGYIRLVREKLEESVQMQLVSDVPLGAFLSGGIDSTILVGLMTKLVSQPVKTFSIGFPQYPPYDESKYAKLVSQKYQTDHQQIDFSSENIRLLPKVIYHLDEPLADPAAIPTFVLSQLAAKEVRVVLSGEGLDELFRGYSRDEVSANPNSKTRNPKIEKLMRIIVQWLARLPRFTGQGRLENIISPDFNLVNQVLVALRNNDFINLSLKSQVNQSLLSYLFSYLSNSSEWDQLSRALYLETKVWLDEPLMKVDKMTMANSLEARVPFLNHELVDLAASIPSEIKLGDGRSKYLLRKATFDLLPREILKREKQGFELPLELWFQNEWKGLVEKELSEESLGRTGLLDYKKVREIVGLHQSGQENYKYEIFSFLCLQLWHRIFIEGKNWEDLMA